MSREGGTRNAQRPYRRGYLPRRDEPFARVSLQANLMDAKTVHPLALAHDPGTINLKPPPPASGRSSSLSSIGRASDS